MKRKLTDEQRRMKKRILDKANQDKRVNDLNALARAAGYNGISEYLTMVRSGAVRLPPCPREAQND